MTVEKTPPCLAGFEHIKRYWSIKRNTHAAKIFPGECYVTKQDEMIVTVLGSCISLCVRDIRLGHGGMNHFLLPVVKSNSTANAGAPSLSYGDWAMEYLMNELYKLGAKKKDLEIKLFGGEAGSADFKQNWRDEHFIRLEFLKKRAAEYFSARCR